MKGSINFTPKGKLQCRRCREMEPEKRGMVSHCPFCKRMAWIEAGKPSLVEDSVVEKQEELV